MLSAMGGNSTPTQFIRESHWEGINPIPV